jgi:hypothetical protein
MQPTVQAVGNERKKRTSPEGAKENSIVRNVPMRLTSLEMTTMNNAR